MAFVLGPGARARQIRRRRCDVVEPAIRSRGAVATQGRRRSAVMMATQPDLLLGLGGVVAFALSAALGANDVANSLGTSVGTGAITVTQALAIGAAMEFAGAVLYGSTVTQTISSGVVAVSASVQTPVFMLGMACVLLGCTVWMGIATRFGLPVSSTHSVVGALIGLGVVAQWQINSVIVRNIALSWLISPIAGGITSFVLYALVRRLIVNAEQPARATRRYLPILTGVTLFVLTVFLLSKGRGSGMSQDNLLMIASGVAFGGGGLAAALVTGIRSRKVLRRGLGLTRRPGVSRVSQQADTERIFKLLQVMTACLLAFSHGSNDVSNAIGPFAAMYDVYRNGALSTKVATPPWVLVMGGIGISTGLGLFGKPVMETVGKKITKLVPTKGFCVELGTALTVLISSKMGLPVSTTHTLIGCIVSLGIATGDQNSVNLSVLGSIAASWLITLPISAFITIVCFIALKPLLTIGVLQTATLQQVALLSTLR